MLQAPRRGPAALTAGEKAGSAGGWKGPAWQAPSAGDWGPESARREGGRRGARLATRATEGFLKAFMSYLLPSVLKPLKTVSGGFAV